MAESDEDYATDTSLESNQSLSSVEEVNKGDNPEKVREKSARKASCSGTKRKPGLPENLKALTPMKKILSKSLRGQDIDSNIYLRVCKAALEIHERYLCAKQKSSSKKQRHPKRPPIKATIRQLFGVGKIHQYYGSVFHLSTIIQYCEGMLRLDWQPISEIYSYSSWSGGYTLGWEVRSRVQMKRERVTGAKF